MTEREVCEILASAIDKGLIVSYSRQRRGWQIREPKSGPRTLSDNEISSYARRLSERVLDSPTL